MNKIKRKIQVQFISKQTQALLVQLAIILGSTLISTAQSSDTLDTGFGTGGKVTNDFAAPSSAGGVAVQPDGKIVAAGTVQFSASSDFALARYNTDGTLDAGFGTDGKVITDFAGG